MNKQQIKAELRRSACEDCQPQIVCCLPILDLIEDEFLGCREWLVYMRDDDCRTFFLLVAEAL